MKKQCLNIEAFRNANNIPVYIMCNALCVDETEYELVCQGRYTLSVFQQICFICAFEKVLD